MINRNQDCGFGQVDKPTNAYNGQKLIALVNKKTPPKIVRMSPTVPGTMPAKYNTPKTTANTSRTVRSKFDMFFFIA